MKLQCKNCLPKEGIEIPEFTANQKQKIGSWKHGSSIYAVKKLLEEFKIDHLEVKFIVSHINNEFEKCNQCGSDKLNQDYGKCPKCEVLNFNWEKKG